MWQVKSVHNFNLCVLKKQKKRMELSFPARIFGYLALCESLKQKIKQVSQDALVQTNKLPFVSGITTRFSPQAAVYIHWSYLKY